MAHTLTPSQGHPARRTFACRTPAATIIFIPRGKERQTKKWDVGATLLCRTQRVASGAADNYTFKSLLRLCDDRAKRGSVCQDEDLMMKQILGTATLGTGPQAPAARHLAGRLAQQWGQRGTVGAGPRLPTPPTSRSGTCQLAGRHSRGWGPDGSTDSRSKGRGGDMQRRGCHGGWWDPAQERGSRDQHW